MNKSITTFFKGLLMGVFETIPGISGSTIALFLGIYEKIIKSLNLYSPNNLIRIYKAKKTKRLKLLKELNFSFLFFLILGMAVAIFSFSHLISYLFENYPIFLLTFFVGFIFSSTYISGKAHFKKENIIIISIGLLLGLALLLLSPQNLLGETPLDIIISGIVTVTFGLLPGISGSFMLLIIGKYEFILHSVKNLEWSTISLFMVGVAIGVIGLVKIIKHFLDNHNSKVLSFFFAFVIGSITLLIKDILIGFDMNDILVITTYLLVGILSGIYLHKIMK